MINKYRTLNYINPIQGGGYYYTSCKVVGYEKSHNLKLPQIALDFI